jgi:hypothetical protein
MQCAEYSFLSVQISVLSCPVKQFTIDKQDALYEFSLAFLFSADYEDTNSIFEKYIDAFNNDFYESIAHKKTIIDTSWNFVSLLYAKSKNIELNVQYEQYYLLDTQKTVLKNIYSSDIRLVNMLSDLLCNTYLEINDKNKFPYEVLVWLKLREKAGLKNPKNFSHPLMNTPIAKMFLSLKEPLPKPSELPFAKELLEKLKEKCPDVEIPEWIKDITQLNIIPEDFMNK